MKINIISKNKSEKVGITITKNILISILPDPPYGGHKYAKFCGNQWNEDWCWDYEELKKLSDDELIKLYNEILEVKK